MSITPVAELDKAGEPARSEPALFRYSTWIHVGAGADTCPEVDEEEGTNGCGDRSHFHAWCRLPNPLQQAEIRERALAAKARRIRQLRDPETDAYAILEEEFSVLERKGDAAREQLLEELVTADYLRDYYDAMMEVKQLDDEAAEADEDTGELPKLYAHVAEDQRRLARLQRMDPEKRPADEYDELERHIASYVKAIENSVEQRQGPKRSALDAMDTAQLREQLRDRRIEDESMTAFRRVFEVNEWLSCAYRQRDGEPVYAELEQLEVAAPEIHAALQATFTDLKQTAQEAQGN